MNKTTVEFEYIDDVVGGGPRKRAYYTSKWVWRTEKPESNHNNNYSHKDCSSLYWFQRTCLPLLANVNRQIIVYIYWSECCAYLLIANWPSINFPSARSRKNRCFNNLEYYQSVFFISNTLRFVRIQCRQSKMKRRKKTFWYVSWPLLAARHIR